MGKRGGERGDGGRGSEGMCLAVVLSPSVLIRHRLPHSPQGRGIINFVVNGENEGRIAITGRGERERGGLRGECEGFANSFVLSFFSLVFILFFFLFYALKNFAECDFI